MTKENAITATQDPSIKSVSNKDERLKVTEVREHTIKVDVKIFHILVTIELITLTRISAEARSVKKLGCHNCSFSEAEDTLDGYVEERMVRHEDEKEGTKYLV